MLCWQKELSAILVNFEDAMHNYEKMYAILCGAVDDVIEELEHIPRARPFAHALSAALLEAEEIYLSESEDSAQVQKPV